MMRLRLAFSQAMILNDCGVKHHGEDRTHDARLSGRRASVHCHHLGLKARGHEAVLATAEYYRKKVEALGLGFRPVRPTATSSRDPVMMRRFMHFRWGTIRMLREWFVPAVRQTYEDILAAVDGGTDLLVSHPITFATRLVAEKTAIPWASSLISPLCVFSAYDPPAMPGFPDLWTRLHFLGPTFWGPTGRFLKSASRSIDRADRPPPSRDRPATADDNPLSIATPPRWSWPCSQSCWPISGPTGPRKSSTPASLCMTRMDHLDCLPS